MTAARIYVQKLREDPGDRHPEPYSIAISGGQLTQAPLPAAPPDDDPAIIAARAAGKAAARAAFSKSLRDQATEGNARELAQLVRVRPGLGTMQLRLAVKEKLGWGTNKFELAAKRLKAGVDGQQLTDRLPDEVNACEWIMSPSTMTTDD